MTKGMVRPINIYHKKPREKGFQQPVRGEKNLFLATMNEVTYCGKVAKTGIDVHAESAINWKSIILVQLLFFYNSSHKYQCVDDNLGEEPVDV